MYNFNTISQFHIHELLTNVNSIARESPRADDANEHRFIGQDAIHTSSQPNIQKHPSTSCLLGNQWSQHRTTMPGVNVPWMCHCQKCNHVHPCHGFLRLDCVIDRSYKLPLAKRLKPESPTNLTEAHLVRIIQRLEAPFKETQMGLSKRFHGTCPTTRDFCIAGVLCTSSFVGR